MGYGWFLVRRGGRLGKTRRIAPADAKRPSPEAVGPKEQQGNNGASEQEELPE